MNTAGWLQGLVNLVYPRICAGCGRIIVAGDRCCWCSNCWHSLAFIGSPLCPRCGRPYDADSGAADHLCGDCIKDRFTFDGARSAVFYHGVAELGIKQLKFGGRLHWVRALSEVAASAFRSWGGAHCIECVVPVPLHTHRLRQRGFNQSGLLARQLARTLDLPVYLRGLKRTRKTHPQTRLPRQQRLTNVKGAFAIGTGIEIEGRAILLVDDVFTTGTTLSECAAALKAGGAQAVFALTVARSLPGFVPPGPHQARPSG